MSKNCSSCGGKTTQKSAPAAKVYSLGGQRQLTVSNGKTYSINVPVKAK